MTCAAFCAWFACQLNGTPLSHVHGRAVLQPCEAAESLRIAGTLQFVPDTAEVSSPASGLLLSFTSDHTCALGPNRRVPSSTGNVMGFAVLAPAGTRSLG